MNVQWETIAKLNLRLEERILFSKSLYALFPIQNEGHISS